MWSKFNIHFRFSDGFCVSQGQKGSLESVKSSRAAGDVTHLCVFATEHLCTCWPFSPSGCQEVNRAAAVCVFRQQTVRGKKKAPSAMLMCSRSQNLAWCYYRNSNSVASVTAGLPWADAERTMLIRFLGVFSYLYETVLMSLYWWEQIRFGNPLAAVVVLKHIEHPQRITSNIRSTGKHQSYEGLIL